MCDHLHWDLHINSGNRRNFFLNIAVIDVLTWYCNKKLIKCSMYSYDYFSSSFMQLIGFVYACYVISIFMEEEDSCKYWYSPIHLWSTVAPEMSCINYQEEQSLRSGSLTFMYTTNITQTHIYLGSTSVWTVLSELVCRDLWTLRDIPFTWARYSAEKLVIHVAHTLCFFIHTFKLESKLLRTFNLFFLRTVLLAVKLVQMTYQVIYNVLYHSH